MFDKEFYPTPVHVLDMMGIDCYDRVVLEPSAGKGDIIDYCRNHGASEILACERHTDLAKIVASKAHLIAHDFFAVTTEQVSHVQLIVMNPPFSNADKHILHAWNIAPEGCEIIALCNYETVKTERGWGRSELKELTNQYGDAQNIGDCFSSAERKTGIEIGLVKLFKPVVSSDFDWDGFFYTDTDISEGNGIMAYNDVRAIVNTYVAAVDCFEKAQAIGHQLNSLVGTNAFSISFSRDQNITTKEQFAREFQIKNWKKVFQKFNMEKYVTKGVMEDINKFINSKLNYPFTMRNIYRMMEIIVGTRDNTMNRAIVEAVDNFTRYTHENRFGVEGWKTNEGHLLNQKFICNYIAGYEFGDSLRIKTYNCRNAEAIVDLQKALCYLTATDFDTIEAVYDLKNLSPNTWYDWGFFEFKLFKKGTGHFKFKDPKVWELLNRAYAKIKGQVIPEVIKERKAA